MIFIFLDGVGIGKPDDQNPIYQAKAEFLPFYTGGMTLPDNTPVKAIDPLLGVDGLPQSATGQTSLYTGRNIPELLGEHKGSYPNRAMREILYQKNILSHLKKKGLNAVFLNAYPVYSRLFRKPHLEIKPTGEFHFSPAFPRLFKRRISTTTCMLTIAGQTAFDEKDILAGRAVFQEFTNRWLIEKGMELPEFSPEKAAQIIYDASLHHDFILYEYFQTDLFAHRHSFQEQIELVDQLNRLIGHLLSLLDPTNDTLLLTSDHGNLEDHTTRSHTKNPVPLITWGICAEELRQAIQNLTDVTPTIENYFQIV